jgi:hypothetical protein
MWCRWSLALVLAWSLSGAQAWAQDETVTVETSSAPTSEAANAGEVSTIEPPETAISELERSLELIYAQVQTLRRREERSGGELLAIGAGAGVGLVVGGAAAGAVTVPLAVSLASTAGMTTGLAESLGAALGTITTVALTFFGGAAGETAYERVAGDPLID